VDIAVENDDPAGTAVQLEGVYGARIESLSVKGNVGLVIGKLRPTNTEVSIDGLFCDSDLAQFPNGIGVAVQAVGEMRNVRATQCAEGLRVAHSMRIYGARLENNIIGLRLGIDPNGNSLQTIGIYAGVDTEACSQPVQVTKGVYQAVFQALRIFGTRNSVIPNPPLPSVGLDLQAGCGHVTVDMGDVSGAFSGAAVNVLGAGPFIFQSVNATNGAKNGGSGIAFNVPTPAPQITWTETTP
jgi:hypothetical protein